MICDSSIYDGVEALGLATDLTGWHSNDLVFARLIGETKPRTIIEVGSWKGASAIHMARLGRKHSPDLHRIYCVDTWLGSPEMSPAASPRLHGYPQVYFQFLHNVKVSGFHRLITPIPQTSTAAARLLEKAGIEADLIYIDASHVFGDLYADLCAYVPLLAPCGVIFGDDCESSFPGVCAAVIAYMQTHGTKLKLTANRSSRFWIMRQAL